METTDSNQRLMNEDWNLRPKMNEPKGRVHSLKPEIENIKT